MSDAQEILNSVSFNLAHVSSGMHLKTALFQTSTVLRLNLTEVRTPSTGGKHQCLGKTQPSTSVLWVTRCLGLQGELNTNLLRSGSLKDLRSQTVSFLGSWHVLWRPTESWKSLVLKDILDYFSLFVFFFSVCFVVVVVVAVVCFTKEKLLFS